MLSHAEKLLLAGLRLQSVHIVVVGSRRLNIYFYHVQGGQRNVSVISVTALTSKMYFRTMWIWWNSSSLQGICIMTKTTTTTTTKRC